MSGRSTPEDDADEGVPGPLAAVRKRLRDVWAFVHGFHRGYARVGELRGRSETRDEDER